MSKVYRLCREQKVSLVLRDMVEKCAHFESDGAMTFVVKLDPSGPFLINSPCARWMWQFVDE
jgi:hypothetical protein